MSLHGKDEDFVVVSDTESERTSDGTRRRLYEEDLEPIKVFLRIREFTEDEARKRTPIIDLEVENGETLVVNPPNLGAARGGSCHRFQFSKICDSTVGQQDLYDIALSAAVKEFVQGSNFLAFNYGVTNAGKTYSMQGTPQQPGLIPRALDTIFTLLQGKLTSKIKVKPQSGGLIKLGIDDVVAELRFKNDLLTKDCDSAAASIFMDTLNASTMQRELSLNFSAASSVASDAFSTKSSSMFIFSDTSLNLEDSGTHSIWVSFVEVYNEVIFDLLDNVRGKARQSLKLCERRNGNVFIRGAKEVCVFSAEEALKVLLVGQKNLSNAATKLNHKSSRSHCLFTIKLLNFKEHGAATITQFSFCDLAGAERAAKTQSKGDRLREAGVINTSLLVLGRCFEALRANQKKESSNPVPFRESKLTRILQNNFMGKARALMIVNISPCADMFNETLHVLKFSAIASEIVLSQSIEMFPQDLKPTKCSLALLRRSLCDRDSLPWEDSREPSSQRSSTIFEEQEEEWETDEEADNEIDYKKRTIELMALAKKLSGRLNKEREDKLKMEMDVREELSEEFLARINQLHEFYQGQMDEVYVDADNLADKKIEIYEEIYRCTKRCRDEGPEDSSIAGTTDSEWKIAELESEVETLKMEVKELQQNLQKSVESEAKKQEELTAVRFQIAEVRREADCQTTLLKKIEMELETTKSSLVFQENLVTDLKNAAAAQTETLEEVNNRKMIVATLVKDFEKAHETLQQLLNSDKTDTTDMISALEDFDGPRSKLSRKTMYFSMSSSSAPSSSETPEYTKTTKMPTLSPKIIAQCRSGADEVFDELCPAKVEFVSVATITCPDTIESSLREELLHKDELVAAYSSRIAKLEGLEEKFSREKELNAELVDKLKVLEAKVEFVSVATITCPDTIESSLREELLHKDELVAAYSSRIAQLEGLEEKFSREKELNAELVDKLKVLKAKVESVSVATITCPDTIESPLREELLHKDELVAAYSSRIAQLEGLEEKFSREKKLNAELVGKLKVMERMENTSGSRVAVLESLEAEVIRERGLNAELSEKLKVAEDALKAAEAASNSESAVSQEVRLLKKKLQKTQRKLENCITDKAKLVRQAMTNKIMASDSDSCSTQSDCENVAWKVPVRTAKKKVPSRLPARESEVDTEKEGSMTSEKPKQSRRTRARGLRQEDNGSYVDEMPAQSSSKKKVKVTLSKKPENDQLLCSPVKNSNVVSTDVQTQVLRKLRSRKGATKTKG